MGLFDRYHCVWAAADVPGWDPARSFAPDAPSGFSVVQSSAGLTAGELWKLIAGFIA